MESPTALLLLSVTCFFYHGSVSALTVEDQTHLCSYAEKNASLCAAKGPADEGCNSIASTISGTEPACYEINVCSFTKDGAPAYVTSDSRKGGYEIIRNCINGYGVANPNPTTNLSSFDATTGYIGKTGAGKYEKPPLSPLLVCNPTEPTSIANCESEALRNDIVKNFHPDLHIGNLAGGFCTEITESNTTGVVNVVFRCVFMGSYVDAATGQKDIFRLHLFNHEKDPVVAAMAYFGKQTLDPVPKAAVTV